jgi:hypothetical protein
VSYGLSGDGWDGRKVVPRPIASGRNYLVSRSIDATAINAPDFSSPKRVAEQRTDPRINPADTQSSATDGSRRGDTVTLNPQPLPPGPDGREANPLARRLPAAGRVFEPGVDPALAGQIRARSAETSAILPPPVKPVARVKLDPAIAANAPAWTTQRTCEQAQVARDRNSPAAPGLAAKCAEQQAWHVDDLAARGEAIAMQDPLALELRQHQPGNDAQRGFDIGMAAAEGQTAPGPGKQRIHDALVSSQQAGYDAAVTFSLNRNKWSKQASCGARMAAADPVIAAARAAEPDAMHRLGFDIGTQFFGPTALGAEGSKGTGPGSLSVRNNLGSPAQAGFDSSFAFHVRRNYPNVYPPQLCVLE